MRQASRLFVLSFALLFSASISFALCGDGLLDAGEECDGTNFNGLNCEKLDRGFTKGTLYCTPECTMDISFCISAAGTEKNYDAYCGDGEITPNEHCDGANLGGSTCTALGYAGGTLSCTAGCTFDSKNCLTEESKAFEPENSDANTGAMPSIIPSAGDIQSGIQNISSSPEQSALILVLLAIVLFIPAAKLKARNAEKEKKEIIAEMKRKR